MALELDTTPSSVTLGSAESRRLSVDFAAELEAGETILSAAVGLTRTDTGASVPASLIGAAEVDGSVVRQKIGLLSAGVSYVATVTVATSRTESKSARTLVSCPA